MRNLRRTRTINQTDMARLVGVTQESISKFERGILTPSFDVQARIAAVLGVSRQDLFPDSKEAVAS
jgi:putative transcriptional regulator